MIHRAYVRCLSVCILIFGITSMAQASFIWNEVGDAGNTLATSNVTAGVGDLTDIFGELLNLDSNPPDEVDMFKLFIPDLTQFYATANTPETELFDAWLFLFDENGFGVAASYSTAGDPTDPDNFRATISNLGAGSGNYYLAIGLIDAIPASATGDIFPGPSANLGEVFGPTGPGGADPLDGWSPSGAVDFPGYRINLRGAQAASVVPEPSSFLVWGISLGLAIFLARRQRLSQRGFAPSIDPPMLSGGTCRDW
jgi:hypothetical protein